MEEDEEILEQILDLYREIEERQKEINKLVLQNRALPNYKDGEYTESIESYYCS